MVEKTKMIKNKWVAWVAIIALIVAVVALVFVLSGSVTGNAIFPWSINPGTNSANNLNSCEYVGDAEAGQIKIGEACKKILGIEYSPKLVSEKKRYTYFDGLNCMVGDRMFPSESSNLLDYSTELSEYNFGPHSGGCANSINQSYSMSLMSYYEGILCCK